MPDLTYFEERCHTGISKLWDALALEEFDLSATPVDVFTRSAEIIEKGKWFLRIAKVQAEYGSLDKVCLFPCPLCSNWTIDEWYFSYGRNNNLKIHKVLSIVSVASIQEARALYRDIMVLNESRYNPGTDSYGDQWKRNNFIVTGSHGRCKICRK